jgi:hypothetical protein
MTECACPANQSYDLKTINTFSSNAWDMREHSTLCSSCCYATDNKWSTTWQKCYGVTLSSDRSQRRKINNFYRSTLTNLIGKRIQKVAGDGQCFYHSLKVCLQSIDHSQASDTVDDMKFKVFMAMHTWWSACQNVVEKTEFLISAAAESDGTFAFDEGITTDENFHKFATHEFQSWASRRSIIFIAQIYGVTLHVIPHAYNMAPEIFSPLQTHIIQPQHVHIWWTGNHYEPMISTACPISSASSHIQPIYIDVSDSSADDIIERRCISVHGSSDEEIIEDSDNSDHYSIKSTEEKHQLMDLQKEVVSKLDKLCECKACPRQAELIKMLIEQLDYLTAHICN